MKAKHKKRGPNELPKTEKKVAVVVCVKGKHAVAAKKRFKEIAEKEYND
jgi:hypothetical protein